MSEPYEKEYKMRATGEDGLNIVVSIPRMVIEKQAKANGMTIPEFLEKFKAVAQFNSFEGVHYYFKPVTESQNA
jgi:hypothetical protein